MESTKKNAHDQGLDPFVTSATIASYCNSVYRNNHLTVDTIGVIPSNGYNPKDKVSKKSMMWLIYF